MFAKSTITLFVLAVGLSSSAYTQSDGISMTPDDPNQVKIFEVNKNVKEGNKFNEHVLFLHDNVIQGGGENYMGSEVDQKDIKVVGKLPDGKHFYSAVTYSSGNTIQQSDSSGKNYMGSRLKQEDITYNVTD